METMSLPITRNHGLFRPGCLEPFRDHRVLTGHGRDTVVQEIRDGIAGSIRGSSSGNPRVEPFYLRRKGSMRGFALLSCVPLLFGCAGGGTVASESGPQNTIDTTIQAASRNDNAAIAASFTPAARQIYQPFFSDPAKMREFGTAWQGPNRSTGWTVLPCISPRS